MVYRYHWSQFLYSEKSFSRAIFVFYSLSKEFLNFCFNSTTFWSRIELASMMLAIPFTLFHFRKIYSIYPSTFNIELYLFYRGYQLWLFKVYQISSFWDIILLRSNARFYYKIFFGIFSLRVSCSCFCSVNLQRIYW